MAIFFNASLPSGALFQASVTNITGSMFFSSLILLFILVVMAVGVFKIPMQIVTALVFPVLIGAAAFLGEMYIALGLFIFYISIFLMRIVF